jgi:hypothetical protein
MDSTRSGLLSTLLMTLPLIVVPALALLRPPNAPSSVSTQNLAADTESPSDADELGFPDDFTSTPAKTQPTPNNDDLDIDSIFGTQEPSANSNPKSNPKSNPSNPKNSSEPAPEKSSADPFQTDTPPPPSQDEKTQPIPKSDPPPPTTTPDSTQRLLQQLNALGCIRTHWFDAGDNSPVGFAAFFRGETELTVYRFEATGQSRGQCVQDVLQQVTDWRRMAAPNQ